MRFGLLLQATDDLVLDPLAEQAAAAEAHGFDLAWVEEAHGRAGAVPSPFLAVAALAPRVTAIRYGVTVDLGGVHPIYVAEEYAATDQACGGRLAMALRPAAGAEEVFAEAVDVVLASQGARPFRHEGRAWTIPANLSENTFNVEERIRVTPPPAQIEPTVWLTGPGTTGHARERGLAHLASADEAAETLARSWSETEDALGPGAARLRRPAVRAVDASEDGSFDADVLVDRLRTEQAAWGLDVVLLRLPETLGRQGRLRAVQALGSEVWPRVQLHRLPLGLEDEWRSRRVRP